MADTPSAFGSKQLEHFRASKRRLPLHPLEKAVLIAVAAHLCFLPWALGTMHVWSQITSLALSAMGIALALIPRTYSGDYAVPVAGHPLPVAGHQLSGGGHRSGPNNPQPSTINRSASYRLNPLPRLLKFPIFWIGLALLAYITIQAFNPSWVWERNERTWWLRRVNDIPWLPTSIDTPFERFNIWRQFIIYASAWLTMCTVWIGFTRRRSVENLLILLTINALLFAGIGIYRKLTMPVWDPEYRVISSSFVLWLDQPLNGATSFASFIYKNHAGAYLALLSAVAVMLALWNQERGIRQLARSTPTAIWLIAATTLAFGVFYTYSRGAILVFLGFLIVSGFIYILGRILSAQRPTAHPAIWILLTGMTVAVIGYGSSKLNLGAQFTSLVTLYEKKDQASSVVQRLDAYAAGSSMLAEHWHRGIGAGGFRFLFPEYIKRYPNSYRNGQLFWEHAHCDWLQFPIEQGAFGSILLLLAGIWVVGALCRHKFWHQLPVLILCCAILQTLTHALFDFPLQNPAILITWSAVGMSAIRWSELGSHS